MANTDVDELSSLARASLGGAGTAVALRTAAGKAFAFSWGSRHDGSPVRPDTVMYGASLTKQVVGLLVAVLATDGLLDVDSPLRAHLPSLPAWAAEVTLRHLLHHTSGLPSTDALLALDPAASEATWTNAVVLDLLGRVPTPPTPPGARFLYSNVGYVCLATALEHTMHQPLGELARARLFEPLQMPSTHLGDPADATARTTTAATAETTPRSLGDGGLWTTAEDLRRWNDAGNAKRFGAEAHRLAETPGRLSNGTPLDYAWGLRVVVVNGRRILSHGGSWPGWRAKTLRCPARGTSVALLTTNDDDQLVSATAMRLLDAIDAPTT